MIFSFEIVQNVKKLVVPKYLLKIIHAKSGTERYKAMESLLLITLVN
jgi:hypothetical protein